MAAIFGVICFILSSSIVISYWRVGVKYYWRVRVKHYWKVGVKFLNFKLDRG